MAKPRLIGIVGGIGSGKDTVAAMLAQHGYTRYAFADAIGDEIIDAITSGKRPPGMPWHLDLLWRMRAFSALDVFSKPTSRAMRALKVWWGESQAAKDPNVWINKLFDTMDRRRLCVIADVRKPREAEAIRTGGGEIWRVKRGSWVTDETVFGSDQIWADVVIENGRTIYDLGVSVRKTIEARGGVRGEVATQRGAAQVPGLFENQNVPNKERNVQQGVSGAEEA